MTTLDIAAIRQEFPILNRKVYDKPLVYLDSTATSQRPTVVLDKVIAGYTQANANVHRGVHLLSQECTEAHESARASVQRFFNAKHSHEILFTSGTTESINLVASSFGDRFLCDGDEVIISTMEHHANIVPWQLLQRRKQITLRIVPITDAGELDMEAYRALFNERTKLVSIAHVSNVLGTINPIEEIIATAHAHEVPVLLDGAQAAPHIKVDVQALDVDFYVCSAHKMYGPTGIGVLYGKEKWLEEMPPYKGGGEMIERVTFEKTTFNALPFKFEAGTPDYIGTTAFAAAIHFIERLGLENIAAHEHALLQYATQQLQQIEGVRLIGTAPQKGAVLSFLLRDAHPYDVGMLLDRLGIAVRTGHHCAQPLMQRLGIVGTVRASFAVYNTMEEVDTFIAAMQRIDGML